MLPVDSNATSYYWSFCSGYMMNRPDGYNMGATFGINNAFDMEIAKDANGNYYGFFINRSTTPELIRLDFGPTLNVLPTFVNLGNMAGTLPADASSLFLMKDAASNWVMFAVSGSSVGNSSLFRMDIGPSLTNTKPNCVNMGNLSGVLNGPKGFFVAKEGPYWYGFAVNSLDDNLIRFDFGTNISNTPNAVSMGNPTSVLSQPSDMAATKDAAGNWHLFVTNFLNNSLADIQYGSSLAGTPAGISLTTLDSLYNPSAIILNKDCGTDYALITNAGGSNLVRVAFSDLATSTFTYRSWNFAAGLNAAQGMSHFIRDKDNLYAFAINGNNSMSQVAFANCTSSTIRSSTSKVPPAFSYTTPGLYNVFLSTDEGLPTASMECHQIQALPIPGITISDDTLICQGDTANLHIVAVGTDTLKWTPNYNISYTSTTVDALFTQVWPDYTRPYHMIAIYPNGCIVDSPIVVNVSKVKADAGLDRVLTDGATTIMGGPLTSLGDSFMHSWTPTNFLSDPTSASPVANPFYDMTYVFTVTNNRGCVSSDTVMIRISCNDLNLPNAFAPEDHASGNDHFGLRNKTIIKLNYFRIFNRWGQQVFSTTNTAEQWDGTFNGGDAPYGVYIWEADGFCSENKRFTRSGNVTLIR
jgi:gliding motility-associated-like protein